MRRRRFVHADGAVRRDAEAHALAPHLGSRLRGAGAARSSDVVSTPSR